MARHRRKDNFFRSIQQVLSNLRPYHYQPLDPTSRQIRLLELSTASNLDDRLEGRLVTANLEDKPVYNALSYMWGEPTPKDIVYINDRPLRIGKNLGQALRHIRYHDQGREPRALWADGICINQQTIKERNHQVGQMGSVYELAQCVCIWIDECTDDHTVTFRHFSESRWELEDPELSPTHPKMQHWKDLLPLFANPYWARLWIQGEVLSASQLHVYLQNTTITGDALQRLAFNLTRLRAKLIFDSSEADKVPIDLFSLFLRTHIDTLCFGEWSQSGYTIERRSTTLATLMYEQKDLEATEPRDRVYGLLPLSKERHEGRIRPDYGLSVREVFLSAFVQYVQLYGDLEFAMSASLGSESPCNKLAKHFPDNSWLRSWANGDQTSYHDPSYCCAGSVTCMPTALSVRSNIMLAHGFKCDALSSVHHLWQREYHSISWSGQWRVLVTLLPELVELGQTGITKLSDTALMVLSRMADLDPVTIYHGLNYWWRRAVEEEEASSTQPVELETDEEFLLSLEPSLRLVLLSLWDSIVFSTQKSCVGSASICDAAENDEIWVIFGYRQPLILRPYGEYYLLVGSAKTHGYMYGEAVGGPDVKGPYKAGDICNGSVVREIKIW